MVLKKEITDKLSHPVKNIILDLGGVLLDIDIRRTLEAFDKLNIDGVRSEDVYPHLKGPFLELELGNIDGDEFLKRMREEHGIGESVTDKQIWDAWNALLLDFDLERFDMIEKSGDKYRLFILSNTNLPHRIEYLKRFETQSGGRTFESYFEKCFYSDELHMRKPDERIYRHVIETTGIVPEETLFIDDNKCNFVGAEACGIKTLAVNSSFTVKDIFE